jgi:hypothetical protein
VHRPESWNDSGLFSAPEKPFFINGILFAKILQTVWKRRRIEDRRRRGWDLSLSSPFSAKIGS